MPKAKQKPEDPAAGRSALLARRPRVAVLGGDGRSARHHPAEADVRVFRSTHYGGNGQLRSLLDSIKAGNVDRVVILTRWLGHSACGSVMALCRKRGLPMTIVR